MIEEGKGYRSSVRWLAAGLMLASAALQSGCMALAVPEQFVPAKKIPALYKPADRVTAVVVDDPSRRLPNVPMAGLIADRVARDLKTEKVITAFIEPREIDALRLNARDFATWPIDRAGRELKAEQVIYVEVQSFDMPATGESGKPSASAYVRVVDCPSGHRLFPADDPRGHPVATELFLRHIDDANSGSRTQIERHLADNLAVDIAKLLYDHSPREVGYDRTD